MVKDLEKFNLLFAIILNTNALLEITYMALCELMGEFTTLFCYSSVCYIPLLLSFFPQVASIPRVTFILLISPAAKITACRSRIGLLPIRLTHYSGPKKVGTVLSLHIVGLFYLK